MESKRRCFSSRPVCASTATFIEIFCERKCSHGQEDNTATAIGYSQDPAPSHKAIETQDLIRNNVPEFIQVDISPQRNNGEWPATSPDLNPLDYSIWNKLKRRACVKKHQSVESLKRALVKAWNEIPQEMIDRAIDDFPKRLRKCIQANGGYFEEK